MNLKSRAEHQYMSEAEAKRMRQVISFDRSRVWVKDASGIDVEFTDVYNNFWDKNGEVKELWRGYPVPKEGDFDLFVRFSNDMEEEGIYETLLHEFLEEWCEYPQYDMFSNEEIEAQENKS